MLNIVVLLKISVDCQGLRWDSEHCGIVKTSGCHWKWRGMPGIVVVVEVLTVTVG